MNCDVALTKYVKIISLHPAYALLFVLGGFGGFGGLGGLGVQLGWFDRFGLEGEF